MCSCHQLHPPRNVNPRSHDPVHQLRNVNPCLVLVLVPLLVVILVLRFAVHGQLCICFFPSYTDPPLLPGRVRRLTSQALKDSLPARLPVVTLQTLRYAHLQH